MKIPLQITSNDLPLTAAIESAIRKKAQKLELFHPRITSCRVVIKIPNKHQHTGRIYNVRLDITIPGKEIVANHEAREDLYAALTKAFDAARRQLEDYTRVRRGDIKQHGVSSHGRVVQLFPDKDYGYIESLDGNERFYFHRSNITYPEFDQLKIGAEVHFIINMGTEGPHAVRVTIGKHRAT